MTRHACVARATQRKPVANDFRPAVPARIRRIEREKSPAWHALMHAAHPRAWMDRPALWCRPPRGESPDTLLAHRRLAVTGTRDIGIEHALAFQAWGARMSQAGWLIVHGGAVGTDMAVAEGVASAKGRMAFVVAGGLDHALQRHPLRHLFDQSWVISAVPPDVAPNSGELIARNALIAALGWGVVAGPTGPQGGTLHTAAAAQRLTRPLGLMPIPTTTSSFGDWLKGRWVLEKMGARHCNDVWLAGLTEPHSDGPPPPFDEGYASGLLPGQGDLLA